MRHGAKTVVVMALAAALAACGGQKQDEQPAATSEATPAAAAEATPENKPPVAFAQCMSCHTVEAGRNMIGPSLHDIVGRPAASVAGYAYSPALKDARLTWDEATLDKWLEAPARLVPGTKMTYAGMTDPAKRKQLIGWLAAQK